MAERGWVCNPISIPLLENLATGVVTDFSLNVDSTRAHGMLCDDLADTFQCVFRVYCLV